MKYEIADLGIFDENSGLKVIDKCSDGFFEKGKNGVTGVYATGDGKVEFISFKDKTIAYVLSAIGYPAYYPVKPVSVKAPIKAVLMDLDGTSVRSEEFWIWIIEKTTASLIGNPDFRLDESDLPFVSGHSVSEHLKYCIDKYCPDKTLEEAKNHYFAHTHREMNEIMEGRGKAGAFTPSPGLKEFLTGLKRLGIKIGLVTSGLYEKAWPEIKSAFDTLDMGKPEDFYDCSISAGFPLRKGSVGTLGELSPKPHPWLYAETAAVGLNIPESERAHVIGIEDSGAGVCSIRLAGFAPIGFDGGNIEKSGTKALCYRFESSFKDILDFIEKTNRIKE
ncbi:MAG: HAD family phosphatase [Eubacteriales bacterium]|nr:HAD family phosphatase [Christensenellaceae bacterium]MDY6078862.1 HAD family phosphatase [Eubacteriales bacterium]